LLSDHVSSEIHLQFSYRYFVTILNHDFQPAEELHFAVICLAYWGFAA